MWIYIPKGKPDVTPETRTILSLYSGAAGLDLGLQLALSDARTVCYVERDAAPVAVLEANMRKGWLDEAPIWTDSGTFDGEPWRDSVDILTCGFPCQPWSVAGQRKGTDDERWLWPHIFRLVREIRPRSIYVENVPGLLHGGIEHVLGDLASVGFDAEWTSVRASDVGAPHRRERVFILGITSSSGLSTGRHREREHQVCDNRNGAAQEDIELRGVGESGAGEGSEALGNSRGSRPQEREVYVGQVVGQGGANMVNTDGERRWQQGDSEQQPSGIDWGSRPLYWPPGPASPQWAEISERYPELTPAKSEVRDLADGATRELARPDQLRILGNGVVPQQAALAYSVLSERLAQ